MFWGLSFFLCSATASSLGDRLRVETVEMTHMFSEHSYRGQTLNERVFRAFFISKAHYITPIRSPGHSNTGNVALLLLLSLFPLLVLHLRLLLLSSLQRSHNLCRAVSTELYFSVQMNTRLPSCFQNTFKISIFKYRM